MSNTRKQIGKPEGHAVVPVNAFSNPAQMFAKAATDGQKKKKSGSTMPASGKAAQPSPPKGPGMA